MIFCVPRPWRVSGGGGHGGGDKHCTVARVRAGAPPADVPVTAATPGWSRLSPRMAATTLAPRASSPASRGCALASGRCVAAAVAGARGGIPCRDLRLRASWRVRPASQPHPTGRWREGGGRPRPALRRRCVYPAPGHRRCDTAVSANLQAVGGTEAHCGGRPSAPLRRPRCHTTGCGRREPPPARDLCVLLAVTPACGRAAPTSVTAPFPSPPASRLRATRLRPPGPRPAWSAAAARPVGRVRCAARQRW